ncbi:MAG: hypothetical protein R6V04_14175 [bacterium]
MKKIMKRKSKSYHHLELARPKALDELKALVEAGFCVGDLDQQIMWEYLEIYEYSLPKFFKEFKHNQIEPIPITFEEALTKERTILVSAMEGMDDFIVPPEEIEDVFEDVFEQWNKDTIRQALI